MLGGKLIGDCDGAPVRSLGMTISEDGVSHFHELKFEHPT
jgi:hypothetical protein